MTPFKHFLIHATAIEILESNVKQYTNYTDAVYTSVWLANWSVPALGSALAVARKQRSKKIRVNEMWKGPLIWIWIQIILDSATLYLKGRDCMAVRWAGLYMFVCHGMVFWVSRAQRCHTEGGGHFSAIVLLACGAQWLVLHSGLAVASNIDLCILPFTQFAM